MANRKLQEDILEWQPKIVKDENIRRQAPDLNKRCWLKSPNSCKRIAGGSSAANPKKIETAKGRSLWQPPNPKRKRNRQARSEENVNHKLTCWLSSKLQRWENPSRHEAHLAVQGQGLSRRDRGPCIKGLQESTYCCAIGEIITR